MTYLIPGTRSIREGEEKREGRRDREKGLTKAIEETKNLELISVLKLESLCSADCIAVWFFCVYVYVWNVRVHVHFYAFKRIMVYCVCCG